MKNRFFLSGLALLVLAGCASDKTTGQYDGMSDPLEPANRAVFAFNKAVDKAVINPAIDSYRYVVPQPVRTGANNALNNLKGPIDFANQLLQADLGGAGTVFLRTIINTTVGFGGLFDFAAAEGIEGESEDFGQTLAVWGVPYGPYVVMPFLGSSSVRDGIGYVVDGLADPVSLYADNVDEMHIAYTKAGVNYFNLRNNLKDILVELEESSIDYYASMRSTYYQARERLIKDASSIEQGDGSDVVDNLMDDFPEYEDF